jgi:hypothetical protein
MAACGHRFKPMGSTHAGGNLGFRSALDHQNLSRVPPKSDLNALTTGAVCVLPLYTPHTMRT